MLNKKISISRLLIGAFFIAIYGNVLFTQLLCAYPHLSKLTEKTKHHHDEATPLTKHSHQDSHAHNNPKDDDCCEDKTSDFFLSQTNSVNSTYQFNQPFLTAFVHFSNNIFANTITLDSKEYFSYEWPPPKIPDIRVFLHSFLI